MSDTPDAQDSSEEPAANPDTPDPVADWEAQLADAAQDPTPPRRNGFDHARKKTFLKALTKGATLTEAAKAACVGKRTVYSHIEADARFAAACQAARQVVAPIIELEAFKRGVTGVEEEVIQYGKHVGTRVKRSDNILHALLKGSNPEKYGPRAGFRSKPGKRKWREAQRARIREELIAELETDQEPAEEVRSRISRQLHAVCEWLRRLRIREEGFTVHEETDMLVPPGWKLVRDENAHVACAERAECAEDPVLQRLNGAGLWPLDRRTVGEAIMRVI